MPTETVAGRVAGVRPHLSPAQLAAGIGLVVALAGLLALVQDPLVHDGLHHFRHVTGITCH